MDDAEALNLAIEALDDYQRWFSDDKSTCDRIEKAKERIDKILGKLENDGGI